MRNTMQYDTVGMVGNLGIFCVMQNMKSDGANPQLRSHSKNGSGTTTFGPAIDIVTGKSYWVNLKYDGVAGTASTAVFDPANAFAQVGSTSVAVSAAGRQRCGISIWAEPIIMEIKPAKTTQSWFGQILIDYTNAAFPLFPCGTTTQRRPAPPTVRDGTGTRSIHSPLHHAVVGQLGPGQRSRKRNPRLPVRHRHNSKAAQTSSTGQRFPTNRWSPGPD